MTVKWSDLPEKAWISRFWALYGRLPESFKKGFIALTRALDRDVRKESRKGTGSIPAKPGGRAAH
jgi:hypothetical protein